MLPDELPDDWVPAPVKKPKAKAAAAAKTKCIEAAAMPAASDAVLLPDQLLPDSEDDDMLELSSGDDSDVCPVPSQIDQVADCAVSITGPQKVQSRYIT